MLWFTTANAEESRMMLYEGISIIEVRNCVLFIILLPKLIVYVKDFLM